MGDETSSQGGIRGPCHQNMQMRRGEEMWVLDSGPLTVFPVLRGSVSLNPAITVMRVWIKPTYSAYT